MEGIEKITAKILSDAQADIDQLNAQTQEKADAIARQARAQADKETADILARGQKAADDGEARKVLAECGYPEGGSLDQALAAARADVFRDMESAVPDRRLVEILRRILNGKIEKLQ